MIPFLLLFLPQPEFINLCFWFVPPSLRGREGSPDYWPRLGKVSARAGCSAPPKKPPNSTIPPQLQPHGDRVSPTAQVAPAIKERMMRKGSMMVGYQPHGARVNFFRQIVTNPTVTKDDLDFFLDEIERLGQDL